jgi:hypothetical protein
VYAVEDAVTTVSLALALVAMVSVSLTVALAVMAAVFLFLTISLSAMLYVLMFVELSNVSLALAVTVFLAIADNVVVGEHVPKLTLHRTDNGESVSSSSNDDNAPSATSLIVADESTLATSASSLVLQANHNVLPSSSSSKPYTGCTTLKHPTQMLFESRIKLLPVKRSTKQHMPLYLLGES